MSNFIKSAKSVLPTLDRILVQRIKAAQKTTTGIYIPEKNQTKLNIANVIAVGPGYRSTDGTLVKPSVNAGDKVLIPSFGGNPVTVGEAKEEFILFRDSEILAKIDE